MHRYLVVSDTHGRDDNFYKVLDIEGKDVIVSNDDVTINVRKKEFKAFGKTVSLGQPYNLNPLLNN